MFGIIADFIASITTILLPIYLSYKSLRTSDPAQTTPWLIYFLTLSLFLLFESWTLFIISWVPFYSWFRLFFLLYLVLPQTQGAKVIYLNYFEPYIVQHEREIDNIIGQAHEKLQSMGLGYLNQLVEFIRDKVLGQKAPEHPQAYPSRAGGPGNYASYASDLLSRFAMPAARTSAMSATSNIYSTLSSALSSMPNPTSSSTNPFSRDLPTGSASDKATYLSTQREHLTSLLRALDKEQQSLDLAYGTESTTHAYAGTSSITPGHSRKPSNQSRPPSSASGLGAGMSKSRSELSFDRIERDEVSGGHNGGGSWAEESSLAGRPPVAQRTESGNWFGGWFAGAAKPESVKSAGSHRQSSGAAPATGQSAGWRAAMEMTDAITEALGQAGSGSGEGVGGARSSGVDYR